jgi:hypothetical protein
LMDRNTGPVSLAEMSSAFSGHPDASMPKVD